jgi:hypothetical protein
MYETILNCPNCGLEQRLVADDVVAERDRLREQLEAYQQEDENLRAAVPIYERLRRTQEQLEVAETLIVDMSRFIRYLRPDLDASREQADKLVERAARFPASAPEVTPSSTQREDGPTGNEGRPGAEGSSPAISSPGDHNSQPVRVGRQGAAGDDPAAPTPSPASGLPGVGVNLPLRPTRTSNQDDAPASGYDDLVNLPSADSDECHNDAQSPALRQEDA